MDRRSDRDLVGAVSQGDRSAYAVLVKRHYGKVFLVCLGVLGHLHDAEDVAQDVMLTGFEKIRQLRDEAQFGPWIARIARNMSINFIRKRATDERTLDRKTQRSIERVAPDNGLKQAIARLPMELRLPLVMYYFDGQDVKSVAETLEISTSGVYAKLRTAIRELHEILTADGEQS